jgi:2-oxoglutarate ferredoxin oxidoreductase subunit alpha
MAKVLMKGNEALAEAAVRAGCQAYYGYPITPQTELLEYMSARMPELGRAFVQAESELAAINMVYGAACTGVRAMTSTSSPGFSLMQEGISYIAGSEIPAVIVNVMRGGPGLGNIQPAQGDYFQMVKGGGHGDYSPIVLAPATLQEAVDHMALAFNLAEKYRTVSMVIADGMIGQMMEPVQLPPMRELDRPEPDYALTGCKGREKRIITSLYLGGPNLEAVNDRLQARWREVEAHEQRWEALWCEDAEVLVVAFGTAARIARTAVRHAHERGLRAGLFRPITVSPFPYQPLAEVAAGKKLLVFELNAGQMLEDVRLAVHDSVPIRFLGRTGGVVPMPEDVLEELLAASEATSGRAPEGA